MEALVKTRDLCEQTREKIGKTQEKIVVYRNVHSFQSQSESLSKKTIKIPFLCSFFYKIMFSYRTAA